MSYADQVGADLIVTGSDGTTGIRKVLIGSVAEQIVRKSRRPVLVVPRA